MIQAFFALILTMIVCITSDQVHAAKHKKRFPKKNTKTLGSKNKQLPKKEKTQSITVIPSAIEPIEKAQGTVKITANDALSTQKSLSTSAVHAPYKIRALLSAHDLDENAKFIIKSKDGFVLECPLKSGVTAAYNAHEIDLMQKGNKLYFRCRDGSYRGIKGPSLEMSAPSEIMSLASKSFQGSLQFIIDDELKKLYVVNKLPLDDYIYSVVRAEGLNSWPLEMHKLQAIISRTYALFLMHRARSRSALFKYFDIKSTNFHQCYDGIHKFTRLRQAVEETKGLVLTYNGAPALAMFDICCGGIIPSDMTPQDKQKPYLARSKKCTNCTHSPSFEWVADLHTNFVIQELKASQSLKDKMAGFTQLEEIKITQVDKAGVVHLITIKDSKGKRVTITGNQLRKVHSRKIKSLAFTLRLVGDRLVIRGVGYGHLKGVCQVGCLNLLKKGWSTKNILEFYYPGTKMSRLVS